MKEKTGKNNKENKGKNEQSERIVVDTVNMKEKTGKNNKGKNEHSGKMVVEVVNVKEKTDKNNQGRMNNVKELWQGKRQKRQTKTMKKGKWKIQ